MAFFIQKIRIIKRKAFIYHRDKQEPVHWEEINTSSLSLVFPSEDMESKALAFKKEFFDHGEKTINGSYKFDMDRYTYSEWLQIIRNNLDKNIVNPKFGLSNTFFAINCNNNIVGIVNFRHTLTDFYKDAGHIGYSVRPSERKKGYATEILRQILKFAKNQDLTEVLLTCRKDNEASRKTIVKNRGIINRTFEKDETMYEEYCISLYHQGPTII